MASFPAVRLSNLQVECTLEDIRELFNGIHVDEMFMTNRHSRFGGDAFVLFRSEADAAMGRGKHENVMGLRRVMVASCNSAQYVDALRYGNIDPREYTNVLRLGGVNCRVKKVDIASFFWDYNVASDNIRIVRGRDGKATGAFVTLASAAEARRAVVSLDLKWMRNRRVELIPSTPAEANAPTIRD